MDSEAIEHLYPGGEGEALCRLDQHMQRVAWVCNFKKPETEPNTLTPSTTVLSPYMKFGCLSARTFWWRLTDVYRGKQHSEPPVSLHGQLLWREFFNMAGAGIPNFHRMEGNSVCVQVDWDTNEEHLVAWREVRKPVEDSDAIMTQLRSEGWIHHLERHAMACFLTRGDLWISWEEGMKLYSVTDEERKACDVGSDLHCVAQLHSGKEEYLTAMWPAGCTVSLWEEDKKGDYSRKYIPLLRKFPVEYIYEPWKAPLSIQERAGCIVRDYPANRGARCHQQEEHPEDEGCVARARQRDTGCENRCKAESKLCGRQTKKPRRKPI
ncbi:cryptochrome-2-like [Acipenser oxyrinchus oxyrinchus]|uniref:Cryptochrome-2-like n=1 Tax=Acipenser oxyrinchus oxyrinchus TaxID=40147 RepID=A0AAD8CQZ4_ACIOX|nr:cryptochrome-2-like [Acipenser oxyrinchus oxyrinchus]